MIERVLELFKTAIQVVRAFLIKAWQRLESWSGLEAVDSSRSDVEETPDRTAIPGVRGYLIRLWQRVDSWARQETARALSNADETPEVTARRMGGIIVRSIPFMFPMLIHVVAIFFIGFLLTLIFTFAGTISDDLWTNKMLVNDKLQPFQRYVLFVDETYLRSEFLDEDELAEIEIQGFAGDELTMDQRRTVRNRMLMWFFAGDILGVILAFLLRYYPAWVWQNVNHYLRVAMVEKLEYLSLSFHHSNRSGDAIYRIYQDSSMVVNVLDEVVVGPLNDIRNLFIAFLFIFAFDPILGIVCLLSFIPMFILTAYATPIIRRLAVRNRVTNSNLTSRIQETFAALKVVKANNAEPIVVERFDIDSHKALDAALYVRFGMIALSFIVGIIGGLVVIGLEYLLITWVLEERETNVPGWAVIFVGYMVWNLAAYSSANGRVGQAVGTGRGFVRLWCMLQDLFIGLERAFYFLDLEPNVIDPESPAEFPQRVEKVAWEGVEFTYEGVQQVLSGVDLEANVGTVTAIVGVTGSGKSTLMSLLLRLYDPDAGSVKINDLDIREYKLDDIRRNHAIAMQKNVLFTGKVTDNIGFGLENVDFDAIQRACEVACADEFIQELSDGYETDLGERGAKLSAGQRQRLTIARAVVRDTPILILDEPTASLDAKTEHQVLENLAEWGKDRVVFLITHRLSTIRNADNIAFLEDGKVVESGTHEALLERADGRYRRFVEAEEVGVLDEPEQ